ncbi:hypothetical protein CGLO_18376 [Colletotrichum gloeosporioides Cg-14]|uniref:Molybdenum cofactor biosynthesis protein F n=1 Tax=Colletotrichum gloeosporioides (strain Cg-14) TaxID=1237896 RepID=T0JRT5_COLGC|nr:hypothetical protein CGLO_18376 [Colletotrichum gloeosporioides Cg-14]
MAVPVENPDYVPVSDWPTLEDMAAGFGEHLMAESAKLGGKSFTHVFDVGSRILHQFVDDHAIHWEVLEGDQRGVTGSAEYKAYEVRENIFFIDFYNPDLLEQISIVLDVATGQAITCVSGFTNRGEERRTCTKFSHATEDERGPVATYQPTDELVGKHILYRYTARDAYEHVYLNKGTMSWHCLAGTENGLADTEQCKMLKLGENLYLLFWTETIMPVESVVVVDLEKMRSTGRFFCWDPKPRRAVHVRFGSYATKLADTKPAEVLARTRLPGTA